MRQYTISGNILDVAGQRIFRGMQMAGLLQWLKGRLMATSDGYEVAGHYKQMDALVREAGAPFMTLSFMALLVIPALNISDKGIFDGNTFSFTPLFLS